MRNQRSINPTFIVPVALLRTGLILTLCIAAGALIGACKSEEPAPCPPCTSAQAPLPTADMNMVNTTHFTNIRVEDLDVTDSQAHATGVYDSTARFAISVLLYVTANYWDGRIGPTAFWKSAAGGGGVLSAAARTALWNGGAGLKYSELTT